MSPIWHFRSMYILNPILNLNYCKITEKLNFSMRWTVAGILHFGAKKNENLNVSRWGTEVKTPQLWATQNANQVPGHMYFWKPGEPTPPYSPSGRPRPPYHGTSLIMAWCRHTAHLPLLDYKIESLFSEALNYLPEWNSRRSAFEFAQWWNSPRLKTKNNANEGERWYDKETFVTMTLVTKADAWN